MGNRFSQLDVTGKKRSAYVDQWKRIKLHKLIKGPDGASLQHVDENWLIHHKNDILRHGVNGVFVSDDDVEVQQQLYSWSDPIADGPPKWPISSGSIPITAQAVLDAVDSLIKVSNQYHLIDPYIWPHSGDTWIATEPIVEGSVKKYKLRRVQVMKRFSLFTLATRGGVYRPNSMAILGGQKRWQRNFQT